MSREDWVVWNTTDGTERWRGQGSTGDAAIQELPAGLAALVVPRAAIEGETINLDVIKADQSRNVDLQAGAVRSLYYTNVPGQSQIYEKKEAEARSYSKGASPADFPFMSAEASLRGVPVDEVQAEIMAQVNLLTPLAAAVESHRVVAKRNVATATNIKEIVEAATIDWNHLLA